MLIPIKGFSVSHALPVRRAQQARRKQGQDTWPKLAKGVFHTTVRHAQNRNCGETPRRDRSLLRSGWVSVGWVVSNCIVHHLGLLWGFFPLLVFYSVPSLFPLSSLLLLPLLVAVLYCTLIIELFLFQPVRFTFFQFPSPSCPGQVSKWLRGSELLAGFKSPQHQASCGA